MLVQKFMTRHAAAVATQQLRRFFVDWLGLNGLGRRLLNKTVEGN